MINVDNKKSCCGCKACEQSCPINCIKMETDNEGFWYPVVDYAKCINCNKCERVCPIINKTEFSDEVISAYAARSTREDLLMASSSGAIFSEISIRVLKKNGVVFGAAFSDDYTVVHKYIESIDDLNKLQGSKYVQSDIGESYKVAKGFLEAGRLVLFSGTACQISGLKYYLEKEYSNLLTIDVLCHGVPSPLVWKKYLEELKTTLNIEKINAITFRDKEIGWYNYRYLINYNDDVRYCENFLDNDYMKLFLQNVSLRPSCHDCKFKNLKRQSDITLGDCWGIENIIPEMYSKKGVSVVIVHSEVGKNIIDALGNDIDIREYDVDKLLPSYADSRKSVNPHYNRQKFFSKVNSVNKISKLVSYTEESLVHKVFRKIIKIRKVLK